jgi:hypothetical protein
MAVIRSVGGIVSGELDELARVAADALVTSMVTDSWDRIKRRFAALVGHERRMDAAHDEIAASSAADRDRLLQEQARAWKTRLLDVLEDDPVAAEGLRALLAELGAVMPSGAPVLQQARADHGSQAVNVSGGITGNTGEVYVGVGKVDKRTVNRFFAPFILFGRAVKQAAVAHAVATAVVSAVVVLAVAAGAGWGAHWPSAVFGASKSKAATATWRPLTWTSAAAPMPTDASGGGALSAVSCAAAGTCVVAGGYNNKSNNYGILVDTASHGQWTPETYEPTTPAGYADYPVNAVACPAPGNCLTAGEYRDAVSGHFTGLVATLSGGSWTASSLPLPAGVGQDQEMELHSLACPAQGNCVAVGSVYDGSGSDRGWGLIQTLRAGTWTAADAPLPADAASGDNGKGNLYGVACPAPGNCMAVGFYTSTAGNTKGLVDTLRNGTWTPASMPLPAGGSGPWLNAVSCSAISSCVAVGYFNTGAGTQGLIETLTHQSWRAGTAPQPKAAVSRYGAQLQGVACPAADMCVAVGYYNADNKASTSYGFIDTLSNGKWTAAIAPSGNAGRGDKGPALWAVGCATTSHCVAVAGHAIESTFPITTSAATSAVNASPTLASSGQASAGATAETNPAGSSTQTFPDGTKVTFVSAEWTALSQYDQAPYGVKFTFHIVAGSQWTNSGRVSLCANCGDGRPYKYYMVTIGGWAYPATNSTGYADLATGITTAQGVPQPINTGVAAALNAGDSVSTSSTLIPPSGSPGEQQVTVTIEMPDTTLAAETFTVDVSPNPNGSQP